MDTEDIFSDINFVGTFHVTDDFGTFKGGYKNSVTGRPDLPDWYVVYDMDDNPIYLGSNRFGF